MFLDEDTMSSALGGSDHALTPSPQPSGFLALGCLTSSTRAPEYQCSHELPCIVQSTLTATILVAATCAFVGCIEEEALLPLPSTRDKSQ
jgi:hypothetical protein